MALLPARNILDGSSIPTTGTMKTAMGSLRDYLAGLLGTDSSDTSAARTALGAAERGANSTITSLSAISSINGGQLAGFRNRLINGACLVSQYPASTALVNNAWTYGGADRIGVQPVGFTSANGTIAQASGTANSGKVQSAVLTSTGSGSLYFGQRIESKNAVSLAGSTVTVQAIVYQNTGSSVPVNMRVLKANSVENFTALTQVDTTKSAGTSVSGVYTLVTATFAIGSGDAANGLQVDVSFTGLGAQTAKTFAIGDFQLELGSVATVFEQRDYGDELRRCKWYYQSAYGLVCVGSSSSGTSNVFTLPMHGSMRVAPTVSHDLTDASYIAGPTSSVQWTMQQWGVAYAAKTGTAMITASATPWGVSLLVGGASFSNSPNFLNFGLNLGYRLIAEL